MKNKFYVALLEGNSIRFVTFVDWANRDARWEEGKQAIAMSKGRAENLYLGLRCNGYKAVTIAMPDYEEPRNPGKDLA